MNETDYTERLKQGNAYTHYENSSNTLTARSKKAFDKRANSVLPHIKKQLGEGARNHSEYVSQTIHYGGKSSSISSSTMAKRKSELPGGENNSQKSIK